MDSEIDRIRQARLAQLRSQGGAQNQPPQQAQSGERDAREAEMRTSVLSQILTPDARERLNRIEMVRPERARQVQQILINMAQSGQLQNKVDENNLVMLLNQVSQQENPQSKVIIRRTNGSDSDSDSEPEKQPVQDDDDDDFFD